MANRPTPLHEPQLAMDETVVTDADLEAALEERLRQKVIRDEVGKKFGDVDAVAKGLIEKLELPEGQAVRVGRFRIARTTVAARAVAFETASSTRVSIALIGEE